MRWLAVAITLFTACRSAPEAVETRPVAGIAAPDPAVSVKMLPDPESPSVELGPGEEYVRPELARTNALPQYPPHLVASGLKPHVVSVRATFDERGNLTSLQRSALAETTESDAASEFRAAVDEALRQWVCYPARIRKFRPGPDSDGDGKPDYRILSGERRLKTFFDFSFQFEVVNGVPVVRRR